MGVLLRVLSGRRPDPRLPMQHVGKGIAGAPRQDSPDFPKPLSYPSDEIVATILAAIRDARPMELAKLWEAVDLSREDLKSGVAALNLEGMIDIVEGERVLGGRYRWFGGSDPEPERRPTASVRITPRGSRFLQSVASTAIPTPLEPTALANTLRPLQGAAGPKDAIA